MAKHTTPMYRAPEMLDTWSNYPVYIAADVWALGCLLYFLCYGRHPFEDSAKLAIINGNYRIPEVDITFEAFHDLIRQMLVVDPTFRPSIGQVQEHLASIAETHGFNISSGDIDFELSSSLSSPEISPSSEAFPTTTTSTASSTDNVRNNLVSFTQCFPTNAYFFIIH
jgi:cyclin G-associated kinase